jgi:23S rRNA (pseudouridine1915-N3)-methyltransferase
MRIQIVCVGKLKGKLQYLQTGIDEYLKRCRPFANILVHEIAEAASATHKTKDQVLAEEALGFDPFLKGHTYRVALTEHGKTYTSERFSVELFKRMADVTGLAPVGGGIDTPNRGLSRGASTTMIMMVGGAQGLAPSLVYQADWQLSLSSLTFPHPLVRLILLEQLYRAFKIQRNEPYHK